VLQCGAVCCSVVQRGVVWCSVVQCVAVWCSVVQCVAVCCSDFAESLPVTQLSNHIRVVYCYIFFYAVLHYYTSMCVIFVYMP